MGIYIFLSELCLTARTFDAQPELVHGEKCKPRHILSKTFVLICDCTVSQCHIFINDKGCVGGIGVGIFAERAAIEKLPRALIELK